MVIVFLCALGFLAPALAAFPPSPCPDVFSYHNDSQEVHGVVRVKNDRSGTFKLEVNMTLFAFADKNIAIRRATPTPVIQGGGDLVYHILFPPGDELPHVASLVFNGKLLCSGTPEREDASVITNLNAIQHFSTSIKLVTPSTPRPPGGPKPTSSSKVPPKGSSASTQPPSSTPSLFNRILEKFECGRAEDTQALVVHGDVTSESQHPWLAAMFHLQEPSGEYKFKCAANLVSNKHVITAAHCVRTLKAIAIPKDNIILVLGKHNIRSWAVKSEIRDVKDVFVHPDYRQPSDADVAVLVMSKTVEFSEVIHPLCMWHGEHALDKVVGTNGTVIGWGRDESGSSYVEEPKEINLPVVSQEECLRSDERFFKITSNRTFCAGSKAGEGVCTGDSGGGFVMRQDGKWTLRGIVSSALVDPETRSCDVNNYMVFSDVTKHLPWIWGIIENK